MKRYSPFFPLLFLVACQWNATTPIVDQTATNTQPLVKNETVLVSGEDQANATQHLEPSLALESTEIDNPASTDDQAEEALDSSEVMIAIQQTNDTTEENVFADVAPAVESVIIAVEAPSLKSFLSPQDLVSDQALAALSQAYPYSLYREEDHQRLLRLSQYEEDLWQELRRRFTLDVSYTDARVNAEINWYKKHQSYFNRIAQRASRTLYYVMQEIERQGIPAEFALLPIVESAYDPFAYSHGQAAGMWQFIPGTGRIYHMDQDWWFDGRRDILASTQGAVSYLKSLANQFNGDWLVGAAAYNSGPGNVRKAQRKAREAGRAVDFWHLDLPPETEAYVPKLIALTRIIADPAAYGITLPSIANEPYFEVVDISGQLDLAQAASMAGISLDEVYLLNPGYNQWATHPDGPHRLLVPVENAAQFKQQLALLPPSKRVQWARHTIKSGESLLLIAKSYNTTVDLIKSVNDLKSNVIRVGDQLMIPTASQSLNDYALSADNRLEHKQAVSGSTSQARIDYTVQAGDSLWEIAQDYSVEVQSLARWNSMAPRDPLQIGQKLVIWTKAENANQQSREVIRKITYTVRNGDSLARIGDKFNVSIAQIRSWNADIAGSKYIQPGQVLSLYVDVTKDK